MLGVLDSCICAFAKEDRVGRGGAFEEATPMVATPPFLTPHCARGGPCVLPPGGETAQQRPPFGERGPQPPAGTQGAPCPGFLYLTV